MAKYPVTPITLPASLVGVSNGKLPASLLVRLGLGGHRLVEPAARAFQALRAGAYQAGFVLSLTDSYRTYAQQVDLKARKPTLAATPGKSNHGLGLAVDAAEDADGDLDYEWPPKSLSNGLLTWLIANAHLYGWSWERQDEGWHIRYVAGDLIPAAVLTFEAGGGVVVAPNPPKLSDLELIAIAINQASSRSLREGDAGPDVFWLQHFLGLHGFVVATDQQFGPATTAAVRAFQASRGLTVDGVAGPAQTWPALLAPVAALTPPPAPVAPPVPVVPPAPAPAPTPPPAPAPAPTGATWATKPGDTWWKIATVAYGSGNQWKKVATENGDPDNKRGPRGTVNVPDAVWTQVVPGDGWIAVAGRLGVRDKYLDVQRRNVHISTLMPGQFVFRAGL